MTNEACHPHTIPDMVRQGEVSPRDGALLLELQRDVRKHQEKKVLKSRPAVNMLVTFGIVVLACLGIRSERS